MLLGMFLFHEPVNAMVIDVYLVSLIFMAANLTLTLVRDIAVLCYRDHVPVCSYAAGGAVYR